MQLSMLTAMQLGPRPMQTLSANILAVIFGLALIWLASRTASTQESRHLNYLMCLFGAIAGWTVGILASPLDAGESAHFITLAQALSAFLSGYVLSKLDRFLEKVLYSDGRPNHDAWVRVGLLVGSLVLTATIVFVNRSYIHALAAAGQGSASTGRPSVTPSLP